MGLDQSILVKVVPHTTKKLMGHFHIDQPATLIREKKNPSCMFESLFDKDSILLIKP